MPRFAPIQVGSAVGGNGSSPLLPTTNAYAPLGGL